MKMLPTISLSVVGLAMTAMIGLSTAQVLSVTTLEPMIAAQTAQETLISEETVTTGDRYTQHSTTKTLPNGDVFQVEKYQFTGEGSSRFAVEFLLEGTSGTVQYVDENREWHTLDIFDKMPLAPLLVSTDAEYWLIEPAFHYRDAGSASMEEMVGVSQAVQFTATPEGILCTVPMTNYVDLDAYYWTLQSKEPLLDLTGEVARAIWGGYLTRTSQRYGYDGYYYETPSSYEPYSVDMFWRTPTAYGPSSFTLTGGSRLADDLSYAWLDITVANAEPEGYWLSYPRSLGFLYSDYGMEGGFYDTRFNTDITEVLLVAYEKIGDIKFQEAALKQVDFFVDFAQNHNYTIEVNGKVGLLVEDYYHPTDSYAKTHCSLNHQLAEIYTLYLAYEQTQESTYLDLAALMLQGIRNTRDMWVMADGGLEYAYMNDGTMGLSDYPYLTYNDLFIVQAQREKMGMERDEDLDYLMAKKKTQMDNNGITGYKK